MMTLQEIITDIHALTEDVEIYERKYGILSETFYVNPFQMSFTQPNLIALIREVETLIEQGRASNRNPRGDGVER